MSANCPFSAQQDTSLALSYLMQATESMMHRSVPQCNFYFFLTLFPFIYNSLLPACVQLQHGCVCLPQHQSSVQVPVPWMGAIQKSVFRYRLMKLHDEPRAWKIPELGFGFVFFSAETEHLCSGYQCRIGSLLFKYCLGNYFFFCWRKKKVKMTCQVRDVFEALALNMFAWPCSPVKSPIEG